MAEDGSWPSIRDRGLLSTKAIVDLYQPAEEIKAEILTTVRHRKIMLTRDGLPDAIIRDQMPLKFLDVCLEEGVTPQEYLDALNGRVFFWVSAERLAKLLQARLYRNLRHTVLHVDTSALLKAYLDRVQLAPYNTGSMHVPRLPDGRTFEKLGAGKAAALLLGERVLIWYDPADPQHILVQGHDGRVSDLVFVIAGAALVAAGAVIGTAAP